MKLSTILLSAMGVGIATLTASGWYLALMYGTTVDKMMTLFITTCCLGISFCFAKAREEY